MTESDLFVQQLRAKIASFKSAELENTIQEDQNTERLNGYLKLTSLAYEMLKRFIDTNGSSQLDPLLAPIASVLRKEKGLSPEEKMLAKEYLFRDFIEYPFTYNSQLINSFDKSDILTTNIVPNK